MPLRVMRGRHNDRDAAGGGCAREDLRCGDSGNGFGERQNKSGRSPPGGRPPECEFKIKCKLDRHIGTRRSRPSRRAKSRARFRACRFRQRSTCLRSARRRRPRLIGKTLKSAIANAENNANLRVDGLVVKEAIVGEGPTMKRMMTAGPRKRQPDPEADQPHSDRFDRRDRDQDAATRSKRRRRSRREEEASAPRPAKARAKLRRKPKQRRRKPRRRDKHERIIMGQKVNPIGFRLAVNRDWRSRWYASPQELPAFPAQRSRDSRLREEEAAVRRGREDRHRARLEQHSRDHLTPRVPASSSAAKARRSRR